MVDLSGEMAAVLPAERARASFDSAALMNSIAGRRPERIAQFKPLFDRPPFNDAHTDDFVSYPELFERSLKRVTEAFRIVRENADFRQAHISGKIAMEDMFEHNGIFLHFSMMLNFIRSQGSKTQQQKWLKRAMEGKFIAAYCQTELGHGSNVRGLETTATFHKDTQEIEIHSPNMTSMKFWPTGMYGCTHALVFANLIIHGKEYGFHGFMVQLRRADGSCMPGVEVGEIGPKMNRHSTNIGYARLSHVRIPMEHMFSKYSQVTPDGDYIAAPPKLSKLRYISMMQARMAIIQLAYSSLAKAVTIAIRYSAVRKQGFVDAKNTAAGECAVLDYQVQQYRLAKALGLAYAILWNTRYIRDFLTRVQGEIQKGNEAAADDLPELHATLSGMKAATTVRAHEAIEECRKCCGGQGFLLASGIAKMSANFSEWVTVEGEQVILSLQLARFLTKAVNDAENQTQLAPSVRYIGNDDVVAFNWPDATSVLPEASKLLEQRARGLAKKLKSKLDAALASGLSFDAALNSVAVLAYKAANAHSFFALVNNNVLALDEYFSNDPNIKESLRRLLELVCMIEITEHSGDWAGLLSERFLEIAEERILSLLQKLRPDLLALVDAFGWTDAQLDSTIGRHDGNVYEAIYQTVRNNPLNHSPQMIGWDTWSSVLDVDFLREEESKQRTVPNARL